MPDQLQYIRWLRDTRGLPEAFDRACERIVQESAAINAAFHSQFLERAVREDGSKFFRQVTEQYISNSYDLADCRDPDDAEEFFWVDPATGQMHPVTLGGMVRAELDDATGEAPFHYASSALVANGQVVGHVHHTDH